MASSCLRLSRLVNRPSGIVLDVVGDHELVHRGHVALDPRLLEVMTDEAFVFLCGHGMFSSNTHFHLAVHLAGNHPFRGKHDATDQSSTRTSIEDPPRGSGSGRRSAWFLAPALPRIAIRARAWGSAINERSSAPFFGLEADCTGPLTNIWVVRTDPVCNP